MSLCVETLHNLKPKLPATERGLAGKEVDSFLLRPFSLPIGRGMRVALPVMSRKHA